MRLPAVFRTVVFSLLLVFGYAVGCGGPRIVQNSLPRCETPPIERPEILVYAGEFPLEPGSSEGVSFVLPLISLGYLSDFEDEGKPMYSFLFRPRRDAGDPKRLARGAAESLRPRLRRGTPYRVTYYQNHRGIFRPPAQGVVVRSLDNLLLYLLSTDEAVPLSNIPDGLTITPTPRVAFRTTTVTTSGCTIQKEHHFIELTDRVRKATIAPGETRIVRTEEGRFEITVFDYSVSSDDIDCLTESPPHFSYLLRARSARK